jgi:hypothetical protein
MKENKRRIIEAGKIIASLAIALLAVQLVIGCEDPAGPGCEPECGTCNTAWDSKAQVCRDLGRNNTIVPANCCGY